MKVSQLNPMKKQRQRARMALLRNPPRKKDFRAAGILLAELALIHHNPRLSGEKKHELFERGAAQLSRLE